MIILFLNNKISVKKQVSFCKVNFKPTKK